MRCIDRGAHIFPYKIIPLLNPLPQVLCGPMNWWKGNLKLYNEDTRRYAKVTGQCGTSRNHQIKYHIVNQLKFIYSLDLQK